MYTKKHLSFSAIRKALAGLCESIDDKRQSGKVEYSFDDCLMSALAMMFFQNPSVLSFQRRMQDKMQNNNLKALFGVEKIPSDSSLCQVLPLAPEPGANIDGSKKQACETNAAKRMVKNICAAHPKLDIIITGDGLYSKQPFVDALKDARMSFVLVAKPADHKLLFEWVHELDRLGQSGHLQRTDSK